MANYEGVSRSVGTRSLMKAHWVDVTIGLPIESSAGKAIASRKGLGKVGHMDVRCLSVQESVQRQAFTIKKLIKL